MARQIDFGAIMHCREDGSRAAAMTMVALAVYRCARSN